MITELNSKAIAVQVPEGSKGWDLWEATMNLYGYKKGDIFFGSVVEGESHNIKLPEGQWSILSRGSEMSEEQWAKVGLPIDDNAMYILQTKEYLNPLHKRVYSTEKSTEAGLSLLKSKSLTPSEVIILIKQ